jgi:PAS domain S-box-containing protein
MIGMLRNSISIKFLFIIGVIVSVFSGFVLYRTWSENNSQMNKLLAKQSELALQFDLAIREYVEETIRPFAEQYVGEEEFVPETMSTSYVARRIFEKVRRKFPDYVIKFSSDDPRNPNNQAGPEELEMIEYFRGKPEIRDWSGHIHLEGKPHLVRFSARRMKESCLRCHGEPSDAPGTLLELYGDKAGFHRSVGDVIALDTVAIPIEKYNTTALANTAKHSAILLAALALLLAAVYYAFKMLVTRRLVRISRHFSNAIGSDSKTALTPIEEGTNDEIGQLANAFNEMTGDLAKKTTSLARLNKEIGERKKAEQKLTRAAEEWASTFDSITDLVSIHDKDCRYVRVNKAFADAFGMKAEEIVGKTCYEIVHGTTEPRPDCPHRKACESRKPHTVEFFEDRLRIYLEVSASPVFDEKGEVVGSVHIAKDITERKKAEKKQTVLLEQVENVNRELKDFASIVSHDLKAPLRGIKTLANWILADCADKLGDEANEQMNLLLERVERMHDLIEGVLKYCRAGQTEGRRVQVNLNTFVPEVINMVVPPEHIRVTIEDELPVIECEEIHIMQILQNLLSNAIKYMDKPQGKIEIGCAEQDGFWKFSIADNGPGIEERHFERIFKIFQALPTSRDFNGTGVGLTVVKKLVELYGGRIWVESQVGEGSTFFFTFPRQAAGVSSENFVADAVYAK